MMDMIKTIEGTLEKLAGLTDENLILTWKQLDKVQVTTAVAKVRGWVMDEIEKRFPKEFDCWMENCQNDDNIESYIKIN